MAPNPPKEPTQQRSVSNIEKRFPSAVNEPQKSGSGTDSPRSGQAVVKVGGSLGSEGQTEGSGDGDQFDTTVTSGPANESAPSVSDASPVVIVSVCLK